MFRHLRQHPFGVRARLDYSLSLTYALPAERLRSLLPPCLEPDTWEGRVGFAAVAMVDTRHLRPALFPAWAGQRFFLIGYRIFVRYRNRAGRNLRGLYILKSATDSKAMTVLGSIFTAYRYNTIDVDVRRQDDMLRVHSAAEQLDVSVRLAGPASALPPRSPFPDWKTARRFAGPLPFTFSYDAGRKEVLIVEGRREDWTPEPVSLLHEHAGVLPELGLGGAEPASAFLVRDIPYYWKKGIVEKWNG